MNRNELKRLSQKYLAGEASAEEKALLNQWYDAADQGWLETVHTKALESEEEVKHRLLENLKSKGFLNTEPEEVSLKSRSSFRILMFRVSTAAAVLALVFFGWQLGVDQFDQVNKEMVNVPGNKIMEILLPDGSKVWLNSGSVFKYPKKFSKENRTVELIDGRAFFEVKHQNSQPFIVKTNNLNVVVLGTSFDVRAYKKEGSTKVSVVTGKVGVTLEGPVKQPAIMLLPKQQVVLSSIKSDLIKAKAPEIAVNAWCRSKLVFEQETLGNVLSVLEKKYNVKIITEDPSLLDEKISITLGDQHLSVIMEILGFTKHFKYKIADDSITIERSSSLAAK